MAKLPTAKTAPTTKAPSPAPGPWAPTPEEKKASEDQGFTASPSSFTLGFALDDSKEWANVLYYGREGTGKTTAAATAANLPNARLVLFINAEGGLKPKVLKGLGVNTSRIAAWPAQGEPVTYAGLEKLHVNLLDQLRNDPGCVTAVVLDSASEIVSSLREAATEDRQRRTLAKIRGLPSATDFDPTFIDRSDYGVSADQAKRLFRRFRDLPCHFIVTALEREDEETGDLGPDIQPAVASALMGYVDCVLHTRADVTADAERFTALTRPNGKSRAKDRYNALPVTMANPSFERVVKYIEGAIAESDDPQQAELVQAIALDRENREAAAAAKQAERAARRARTTAKTSTTK